MPPGSIPARTGEPSRVKAAFIVADGLSPRVRGNPAPPALLPLPARSIPARTGEPSVDAAVPVEIRVYPRAYGGTVKDALALDADGGLSPRVRGNPFSDAMRSKWPRSIPARTGEPRFSIEVFVCPAVYPRAYGGTG